MHKYIDFSKATCLAGFFYGHNLFQYYGYGNYKNDIIFQRIENDGFSINEVSKIHNPQLYGMYLLQKEELLLQNENNFEETVVKEVLLYHVTSVDNARSIAKNNIDWRLTRRSRFGMGACFSPRPCYAHKYSSSNGAIIIFEVLMKNVEKVDVCYGLQAPVKLECDTTSGNGDDVFVKYDDNTFYPKYIVYYTKKR